MGKPLVSRKASKGVTSSLASAFLEWFLIFLLFIDGFFSYLITKFARYCELQIPCLLCSRIDHVLGNGKDGGYQDLICTNHKLEISSLVLCCLHNKIVDVHGICESCLFSFATVNKSNAETYRLLVGKLGPDPHIGLEQDAFFREKNLGSSGSKYCSCCCEQLTTGGHVQKLLQTRSIVPDDLKNIGDELTGPRSGIDHLSHIEYKKVKISSDSESEVPFSDEDDVARALIRSTNHTEEVFSVPRVVVQEPRIITLDDEFTSEKLIKVEISSDSESQVPLVDNVDGARTAISDSEDLKEVFSVQEPRVISEKLIMVEISSDSESENDDLKEVFPVQRVDQEPRIIKLEDDSTSEILINSDTTPEHSNVQLVDQEPRVIKLDDDSTSENLINSDTIPEHSNVQLVDQEPRVIKLDEDLTSENLINSDFTPEHSDSKSEVLSCVIKLDEDLTSGNLVNSDSTLEHSDTKSEVQPSAVDSHGCESIASCTAIGHGLEELNWQQVEDKSERSITSELITFDDVPSSSNLVDTPDEVLRETVVASAATEEAQESATENGEMFKVGGDPNTASEIDINAGRIENGGISKAAGSGMATQNEAGVESNSVGLQIPNNLELGDAYKIALGTRGKQLSGKFSEQISMKDSTKLEEDLKQLLSQLTSARGMELPLSDMSPRVSGANDESKPSDAASSTIGMHIFQRRISLERNESGLSMDGSTISEIDGETAVDRLKRQVEHDKKLMGTLYKELEEERNASSIAANQAMAMITRLQEEKAALHMEALQCLRMMEEQAEYDVEALQKANDLLSEKEKEIQDLEAELEVYRNRYGEISMFDNITTV